MKFTDYLVQDYLYLKEYTKVFCVGVVLSYEKKKKLKDIFIKSCIYEMKFWDMAYKN